MLKRNGQAQCLMVERKVLGEIKKVKHPYIVDMHYAFQTKAKLYFVLTYCPGGELFFHLSRNGPFDEAKTCFYGAEILLALGCLHGQDIIYRDLKPENVLLDADGHVRLADFGTSKLDIKDNVSTFSLAGTPEYLAPEVIHMIGHGKAADWWAYGCLIFEMLTGAPPFNGQSSRKELFENICEATINMPRYLSKNCKLLIAGLLCRDIRYRIGSTDDAEEFKNHPFFKSIDWEGLERRELEAPWKPDLEDLADTSNFDEEFTEQPIESEPSSSGTGSTSLRFENFSYVESHRTSGRSSSHRFSYPASKSSVSGISEIKTPIRQFQTLKELEQYPSSSDLSDKD